MYVKSQHSILSRRADDIGSRSWAVATNLFWASVLALTFPRLLHAFGSVGGMFSLCSEQRIDLRLIYFLSFRFLCWIKYGRFRHDIFLDARFVFHSLPTHRDGTILMVIPTETKQRTLEVCPLCVGPVKILSHELASPRNSITCSPFLHQNIFLTKPPLSSHTGSSDGYSSTGTQRLSPCTTLSKSSPSPSSRRARATKCLCNPFFPFQNPYVGSRTHVALLALHNVSTTLSPHTKTGFLFYFRPRSLS